MARSVNYIENTDLAAFLTSRDMVDCLDDDGDGVADTANVTACIEAACDEIDGYFQLRGDVETPLDVEVEKSAPHWAKYLFVAHAFQRRNLPPERSGHGAMVKTIRDILDRIAQRRMSVASVTAGSVMTTGANGADVPGDGNVIDVVAEETMTIPGRVRLMS